MTLRFLALLTLLATGSVLSADQPAVSDAAAPASQEPHRSPLLLGHIADGRYYAPGNAYSVALPVLHGDQTDIRDNGEIVVFKDRVSTLLTIAAFEMPRIAQWEYETSTPREYLIDFFRGNILRDYRREFPDSTIEDARFIPEIFEGALVGFTLLPGGSAFSPPEPPAPIAPPPVAKRGHLVFVRDHRIFVIAIELAERVTRANGTVLSTADEDRELFDRLVSVLGAMRFGPEAPTGTPIPVKP